MSGKPPLSHVEWQPCWRLIPSRFPPTGLFDRVADPGDLDIVYAIESLTNNRLRDEAGDITLVKPEDRISGPGTTPIMSAFTHLNPLGSRFSDGSYGVYYAAQTIDTAIAETKYHRALFLAATDEPPIEIDMRSYASGFSTGLHDVRKMQGVMPEIYHPDPGKYAAAQILGKQLRESGSNGLVYDSVRKPDGECVALFRPCLLSPVRQGAHYCYVWNGARITDVYVKTMHGS